MNDTGLDIDYQALDNLIDPSNRNENDSTVRTMGMEDGGTNNSNDPANFPAAGDSLPTDNPVGARNDYNNATAGLSTDAGVPFDQFPQPGASRTNTTNGTDLTTSNGVPDPRTNSIYTPSPAEQGLLPGAPAAPASAGMVPAPSATDPNSNYITSLLDQKSTGPQLPGACGGNLSAQDRLVRDASGNVVGVRSENGYYDPNFQSTSNMLDNYQRGDKMAGTVDALHILAAMGNENAKRVLGAEAATGSNMGSSMLEANWAKAHNAEIGNSLAGGAFGNNQAARSNLAGQEVQVNQNPLSNDVAFPEATKMMQSLEKLKDVDAQSVHMDSSGNVVFQDTTGTRHIPMNQWNDWLPVIEGKLATQNTPTTDTTAPTGQGGGSGRNAPRGNGGPPGNGYTPPGNGYTPPGGGPTATQFPGGRPVPANLAGAPESVQSAYAFSPGIRSGGMSPYDEPRTNQQAYPQDLTDYGNTNFQPNLTAGQINFGPFPSGSAGNPDTGNGSIPGYQYGGPGTPPAASIPIDELMEEIRRRGLVGGGGSPPK